MSRSLTYSYLLEKYGLSLTWEQAAEELGVYWENIRRMCRSGEIRAEKVGRKWMLTTKALADYIDRDRQIPDRKVVPISAGKKKKWIDL